MWTLVGVRLRRRVALDRHRHLLADVRHFIAPDLASMIESGTRLMITDKGHIGWAHQGWQRNDALYKLKGCRVPVILKPRADGGFLIVEDTYIQGLMNGEAV